MTHIVRDQSIQQGRQLLICLLRALTAAFLLLFLLLFCMSMNVHAAEYEDGYDVSIPHVIVNQVYGMAAKDGYASHSFIELYNPTEQDVNLSGWSVQYCASPDARGGGAFPEYWDMLALEGTIPAKHSFLIRCKESSKAASAPLQIDQYDQSWDREIHNKGFSVVLFADTAQLSGDAYVFDPTGQAKPRKDYVDMLSAQGNDGTANQAPVAYEGGYSPIQSKKKGVRRKDFRDTDNNAEYQGGTGDVEEVDYSSGDISAFAPHWTGDGAWGGGAADNRKELASEIKSTLRDIPKYYESYCTELSVARVTAIRSTVMIYEDLEDTSIDLTYLKGLRDELNEAVEALSYKSDTVLPQVYLTTDDGTGNSYGNTLSKSDDYVSTHIALVGSDGKIIIEDRLAKIKIRGNTTSYPPKKPYSIKLSEKQNLFGFGKSKKWVLLADAFDPSLFRNEIAFSIAKRIGLSATTDYQRVEVWTDGAYQGTYLLTEKIEADKNRVNIDVNNDEFLIEMDGHIDEGNIYFQTDNRIGWMRLHEPEDEKYVKSVKEKMNEIEDAFIRGDYDKVCNIIDISSFAQCYVVNEYMKNIDYAGNSVYFYFHDGKLYAGPVWDFDLSSGNINKDSAFWGELGEVYRAPNQPFVKNCHYFKFLMQYPEFRNEVYKHFMRSEEILSKSSDEVQKYYQQYKGAIERNFSQAWDINYWGDTTKKKPDNSYIGNLTYLTEWLSLRYQWMKKYLVSFEEDSTGIFRTPDGLHYYHNGVKTPAGLLHIDNEYYYAGENGEIATGHQKVMEVNEIRWPNGRQEFAANIYYDFDDTGRMLVPIEYENVIKKEREESTCLAAGTKEHWQVERTGKLYDSGDCAHEVTMNELLLPLAEHDWGSEVIPPTAAHNGYTLHTCSVCGASYQDEETLATGIYVPATAQDCTHSGLRAHYKDTATGLLYSDESFTTTVSLSDLYVGPSRHNYRITVIPPTAASGGYTLHTCSVCGYSYTDAYTDPVPEKKPVTVTVSGLIIDPVSVSMKNGETAELKVLLSLSDGQKLEVGSAKAASYGFTAQTAVWKSSSTAVAAVSSTASGKASVKAVSGGSAVVTAACGGLSASCRITVAHAVSGILLDQTNITLQTPEAGASAAAGNTASLGIAGLSERLIKAEVFPAGAEYATLVWRSSDSAVFAVKSAETAAGIDENTIVAVGKGSARLTVTVCDSNGTLLAEASCSVKVTQTAPKKIALDAKKPVVLSETEVLLRQGASKMLSYTMKPASATDVSAVWTAEDNKGGSSDVIRVAQDGTVYALETGSAEEASGVVRLTLSQGEGEERTVCSAAVKVRVLPAAGVQNIVLEPKAMTLSAPVRLSGGKTIAGSSGQFTAAVYPQGVSNGALFWSAAPEGILSVDDSGRVTALAEGEAVVTAVSAQDGNVKASAKVRVEAGVSGEDLEALGQNTDAEGTLRAWIGNIPEALYTGAALKPEPNVYYGTRRLTKGIDYTLSYANNTKASVDAAGNSLAAAGKQPSVRVSFRGSLSGSLTGTFAIRAAVIGQDAIARNASALVKTKTSKGVTSYVRQELKPLVTFNGKTLSLNKDYRLSYPETAVDGGAVPYASPGSWPVVITGMGSFAGSSVQVLEILTEKAAGSVNLANAKAVYNVLENQKLARAAGLKDPAGLPDYLLYDGTAKEPVYEIKATVNGVKNVTLEPAWYDAVYTGNINAGTASVTFTGNTEGAAHGLYGQKKVSFQIKANPVSLRSEELSAEFGNARKSGTVSLKKGSGLNMNGNGQVYGSGYPELVYGKGGVKPGVAVRFGGETLIPDKDYTISFSNDMSNPEYMTGRAVIRGKGRYKDTVTIPYTIAKQDISLLSLSVEDFAFSKTKGAYKKNKIVLKDLDGRSLTVGSGPGKGDYYVASWVAESETPSAGSIVEFTLQGSGVRYSEKSVLTGSFRVIPASAKLSAVKAFSLSKSYTGSEIRLSGSTGTDRTGELDRLLYIVRKVNGVNVNYPLYEGIDFEVVSYTNNTRAGTAKVTLKGIGLFGGTKTVSFMIRRTAASITAR